MEDADQYRLKRSELGKSCKKNTSTRRLLESFTDGIYLIKTYKGIDDLTLNNDLEMFSEYYNELSDKTSYARKRTNYFDNPEYEYHTKYCEGVRPFDDLIFEMIRWKEKSL